MAVAVLLSLLSCSRYPFESVKPEALYQSAIEMLMKGHLAQSQIAAERGRKYFSSRNSAWMWKFQLLEAETLILRGLSSESLEFLDPELPPSFLHTDLAIKQRMLSGVAQARLGKMDVADRDLSVAQHLCEILNSLLCGEVARSRGAVQMQRDDLGAAAASFRESLQLAREHGDNFLATTALLNLGFVSLRQEHYDESIDWSTAAEKISNGMGFELNEEKILGNLGWAYYKMGDFERALSMFKQAVNRSHELGAVIDEIAWLNNEGLVYNELGRLSEAEGYYQRSLVLALQIKNTEETIDALTAIAFASLQQGQNSLAATDARRAIALAKGESDRTSELYPLLALGKISAADHESGDAEKILQEVAADGSSDFFLRWESKRELAKLYERQGKLGKTNDQFRRALSEFECARSSLKRDESRLPFLANGAALYDDYIQFLVRRGKVAEALQIADYSRARTLAEGLGTLPTNQCGGFNPTPLDVRQTASRVGSNLLFYWLSPEQSFLWVVNARSMQLFPLPATPKLETLVQDYKKALEGSQDVLQARDANGSKLYDALIAPARALLANNSRVIVISDGLLSRVNFETLVVREPKVHFLIEDLTISNATSIRMLSGVRPRQYSGGKLLLIGDAIPVPEYPALPKAAVEIEDVEKHFAPAQILAFSREQATSAAYLQSRLEQFSYIHFVAHGTASQLSPLDSAVVLSKSSDQEDSFKLYARDIVQHPLRANLVTISTCYGAGSRAYTGEGLVGLSWAFLRAGAHDVIGALWAVNDSSTPQLMDTMYAELNRGQPPEVALRAAKIAMLHSEGVFRKPYYWAPFQLYTGS